MQLELKTKRLNMRPLRLDDVDLVIEQWTDREVVKYIHDRDFTEAEIRADMPENTQRAGDGCIGIWCLTDRQTGEKLGTAILLPLPVDREDTDWSLVNGGPVPEGDIEIGYILKRSAWGNGYAPEACGRLLQFAFEESPLEEIVAVTDPDNLASQHILQKCGLRPIGPISAYQEELPGFKITKPEWAAAHS